MDESIYSALNQNALAPTSGPYIQGTSGSTGTFSTLADPGQQPMSYSKRPAHTRANTNASVLPLGMDANEIASAVDVLQRLRDGLSSTPLEAPPREASHSAALKTPLTVRPVEDQSHHSTGNRVAAHVHQESPIVRPELRVDIPLPLRSSTKSPTRPRRSLFASFEPPSRRGSTLFGPGGPATTNNPQYDQPDDFPDSARRASYNTVLEERTKRIYIVKLCRCLLIYGAPVHRLERYLAMTAAVLHIKVEFFYLPDHITMFFENSDGSTEIKLVRGGGTDLGRWLDVHRVSKNVISKTMTVEQGTMQLDAITSREGAHSDWFLLVIYGLAGVGIGPFAYGARFIDLPVSFILGMGLGVMQLKFAPRNALFSIVFEVSAAIIMSFLGRMIGSILNAQGNPIFCYSALTESAINLIQPGYWITNACLELMNRQIATSGARFMYALLYALLLAYGIAIGSSIYGLMDHDAVSATACDPPMSPFFNLFFVPFFSAQVAILGGAKWSQVPAMVIISLLSFASNFGIQFAANGSFTVGLTVHGLVMGILGNLYSRVGHAIERPLERLFSRQRGSPESTRMNDPKVDDQLSDAHGSILNTSYTLAAAAMVPAMIVAVPSGLANRGSFLGGITTADAIVRNATSSPGNSPLGEVMVSTFPVYLNVVQIGLALAVGLSFGALIVYPFNKRRSGVMSW